MRHQNRSPVLLRLICTLSALLILAAAPRAAWSFNQLPAAQWGEGTAGNLANLSIEELMNIKITSTARKPVRLSEATSAVFVITAEDIRHSGAMTIPDILRMVPGLEVAGMSANQWAVSARGFNGRFANKLLVLIDGRSIYTPAFSGVYWEAQDLLLEDIERIEVIRGPGATIWGANAVNGVINIITKSARNTQGGLAVLGAGNEERGVAGVRYGGTGGDAAYRVYAKHGERDGAASASGESFGDDAIMDRGGFRLDWAASAADNITIQGDAYSGLTGQLLYLPSLDPPYAVFLEDQARISGGNILSRWQRRQSAASDIALQVYYDRTERREETYHEYQKTVDIAFDHRFRPGTGQEIVWGMGYRSLHDEIYGTFYSMVDPAKRRTNLLSAFIQDEITAIQDRLAFTVGTKIEHNDYTGYEFQPSARMLWTPHERHSIWSSVSRAVRTPSRFERDVEGNIQVSPPNPLSPVPTLVRVQGNSGFRSEEMIAYEAGYRLRPAETFSTDIAVFYNVYDNLRSAEPGAPSPETLPVPHVVLPVTFDNKLNGRVHGLEVAADWRIRPWWSLNLAYTFLDMHLYLDRGSRDTWFLSASGENPRHQASLRSSLNLPGNLEFDAWFRYVDELPSLRVDDYVTLDIRVGWKPARNLELVLAGRNLLENRHQEFVRESFRVIAEIERSVYGKAVWSF